MTQLHSWVANEPTPDMFYAMFLSSNKILTIGILKVTWLIIDTERQTERQSFATTLPTYHNILCVFLWSVNLSRKLCSSSHTCWCTKHYHYRTLHQRSADSLFLIDMRTLVYRFLQLYTVCCLDTGPSSRGLQDKNKHSRMRLINSYSHVHQKNTKLRQLSDQHIFLSHHRNFFFQYHILRTTAARKGRKSDRTSIKIFQRRSQGQQIRIENSTWYCD